MLFRLFFELAVLRKGLKPSLFTSSVAYNRIRLKKGIDGRTE